MKKIVSLLLLLGLFLVITGCENIGLNDKEGFGKLIVSRAFLEDGTELINGTVKVDGREAGFGEEIVLAKGTYRVSISDDYGNKVIMEGIVIDAGEITIIEDLVLYPELEYNAWKFIFNPEKYGLNIDEIEEVHLVGDKFGWDPADKTYSLMKKGAVFTGIFAADEGTGFKFIYNGEDWSNQIGDNGIPGDGGSGNIVIGNTVETEAVFAWKFMFDPEKYGLNIDEIEEVHLVGDNFGWDPADKTYSLVKKDAVFTGIFAADEGTGFKFIYNGEDWSNQIGDNGIPGDGGSGNIIIGATDETTVEF